jgi:hypothetical protein
MYHKIARETKHLRENTHFEREKHIYYQKELVKTQKEKGMRNDLFGNKIFNGIFHMIAARSLSQ